MSINQAPVLTTGDANGIVTMDFGSSGAFFPPNVALQADGKILVNSYAAGSGTSSELVRYNADGSLDTTFGADGIVSTAPDHSTGADVAVQADGKIVVAGSDFTVARYNSDGSLDASFGTGGTVAGNFGTSGVSSLIVQADGKIVAAGLIVGSAHGDIAVARYDTDGSLDASFGVGGKITTSFSSSSQVNSIVSQPDGKLVVAAGANNGDFTLLRYNNDGSLDASFGTGGTVTTDFASATDGAASVTVQADGKIVASGFAVVGFGAERFAIARYNADGSLDASFGAGGKVTTDMGGNNLENAESIRIQPDGKIVVAGYSFTGPSGTELFALARYNSDGSLDNSFGSGGKVLTNFGSVDGKATSLVIQPDGRMLVVGTTDAGSDVTLARYNSDGSLDTSFGNSGAPLTGPAFYTEGASPIVLNARATVHDAELAAAGSYDGASLTLTRHGGANSDDVFGASGNLSALSQGADVTLSGVAIGTVTQNSGGVLVLTFGAAATEVRVDEAMRAITYKDASDAPGPTAQIDWSFSDGNTGAQGSGGALAAAGVTNIKITGVNDAPVNTAPGGPLSAVADTDFAITGLGVSDPDSASLAIFLHVQHGTLTIAAVGGATVAGSGTSDLIITGSPAQLNATLGATHNVLYHSAADFSGADTLSMITGDNAGLPTATASSSVAINVTTVPGSVAINDVTISEGDSGTKVATFTVTRSDGTAPIAVDFATSDGGATIADNDYVAASGTLNFDAGVKTQTISVTINGDGKFEPDETFTVNLSGATNGATISDGSGTGTVTNDDAEPAGSVVIDDVTITEGDSGTKVATFTVTRSNGTAAFAVNFATANGTATTADNDYVASSGTLNFAQGDTTQTISVTIKGDIKIEPDQTFTVNLSGATNGATISDAQGVGTIANDDANHAPQITAVTGGNITVPFPGRILSPSDLFSASDLDNDLLTYFIYDWSPAANSGHFEVRGAVVPAQTVVGLTAADLTFTRFIAGAAGTTDDLGVMAFDGHDYSGNTSFTPIHVNVPANHAPVVTVASPITSARAGQVFAASSLFSASDADGNSLVYFLYDWSPAANSGHFVVNGAVVPAQTVIGLSAADLAKTTFVAGALGTTDDLGVMVFDGTDYSGNTSFSPIHVTAVNHAPVVTVPEVNVAGHTGQALAASSLFSVSDADNDALTYFIYDWNAAPDSGHFVINGAVVAAQTVIGLTPTDLAHTSFVVGSAGATDDLGVMAFDGHDYSGNTSFNPVHVTGGVNHAPVVTVPSVNATASPGQVLAASDLFSVSDTDNDALTYFIYDWNSAPDSGHFVVNGAVVPAQTVVGLTASDIAHTTFVAGALGATDDLGVMVYDGFDYSGNTSFNPIHVTAINHAPVVMVPQTFTATAGQVYQAGSLFNVTDADHDALTYFLYDWSPAANSGHFEVNGAVVPAQTVIGLTASDLAHTTFVAGSAGAVDDLGVMAFDGHDYSSHTSFDAFHILV